MTFLQELHYYPFGMLMEGIGTAQVTNNGYKYNGKELNEDLGLNLHDYGARWYDASLGRWWSVDPLGEVQTNSSSYVYVYNNPMSFIDPTGMIGEGADGLTNEQWLDASKPGDHLKADSYRKLNRDSEVELMRQNEKLNEYLDEQGSLSDFELLAKLLNKGNPNLKAGLAMNFLIGKEENKKLTTPQSLIDQMLVNIIPKSLAAFVKAVKKADPGTDGTIGLWLDPVFFEGFDKSPKVLPLLSLAGKNAGVEINDGMVRVFDAVIQAFKSEGINLGSIGNGRSNMIINIWIKPYSNTNTHSCTLLWIPTKV